MSQHTTNEHIIRVITLYDKLNLDKEKIKNGVSIIFYMDNSKFYFIVLLLRCEVDIKKISRFES
jgi:hypothetical protein